MSRNEVLAVFNPYRGVMKPDRIYRWSPRNAVEFAAKLATGKFQGPTGAFDAANEISADKVTICYDLNKRDILNIAKTLKH